LTNARNCRTRNPVNGSIHTGSAHRIPPTHDRCPPSPTVTQQPLAAPAVARAFWLGDIPPLSPSKNTSGMPDQRGTTPVPGDRTARTTGHTRQSNFGAIGDLSLGHSPSSVGSREPNSGVP